ncbi:ATP-binding protein [Phaeovibrio sulfidiphilus]|uniref:ATP-binding protein n=1 Tax=Phaeovibrio sulfidiphilus TaxID=1220600 RepID=A0A8J7CQJ3_9PROT|nr:ATP-binding protein [Phaeovibrio sulfidiphilus]MBE1236885.1 ATP-binding protein [Phaeovibrio sulfidiphilus]
MEGTLFSTPGADGATPLLRRIAEALERLSPPPPAAPDLDGADAFIWSPATQDVQPVARINRVDLTLLQGLAHQSRILLENTRHFAAGLPANNALLWGARGTGKSALVKAVHGAVNTERDQAGQPRLALVEIHREDIATLPALLARLSRAPRRCILFCDDLSFDSHDTSYKSLKAVLDGGIQGRPDNVVLYATSNRRHLLAREMIENESSTAIHAGEAVEEKVSLSDRFGLWLGFHNMDQDTYLAIVEGYVRHYGLLDGDWDAIRHSSLEWALTRGSRSGRTAWQFILDLAGKKQTRLSP